MSELDDAKYEQLVTLCHYYPFLIYQRVTSSLIVSTICSSDLEPTITTFPEAKTKQVDPYVVL